VSLQTDGQTDRQTDGRTAIDRAFSSCWLIGLPPEAGVSQLDLRPRLSEFLFRVLATRPTRIRR